MDRLSTFLPSIKSLEMFQSIVRHGSLSRAAELANVTQPSVSKQIGLLEKRVGFRVFERNRSGITLTPDGKRLFDAVELGFKGVSELIHEIRKTKSVPVITIQTDTEFACFWLLPVIKALSDSHPKINTSIISSYSPPNFLSTDVDIGVTFGDGNWTGYKCTRLFYEEVYTVCSPQYLSENPQLSSLDDLEGATLIGWDPSLWEYMDWEEWYARLGRKLPTGKQRLKFNNFNVALQAAVNGQGLALGWKYLTDPFLQSGQLVRPFEDMVRTNRGQFLLLPNQGSISKHTMFLHDWILEHASAENGKAEN